MLNRLRVLDRCSQANNSERPRDPCSARGCPNPTSEGKLWCVDHLTCSPYVARLVEAIETREAEEKAAAERRWQDLDPRGSRAREILDRIAQQGPQSLGRLQAELQLGKVSAESWMRALEAAGLVEVETLRIRRGRLLRLLSLAGDRHARPRPHRRLAHVRAAC